MTNLRKGFSLPAPLWFGDVAPWGPVYPSDATTLHPNDYRQPSVRNRMLAGPAPATWVKFWINFNWLLSDFTYQDGVTTYGDVWDWLNRSPQNSYAIQRLDRMVKAANQDGKYVVIGLYQSLPEWCIGVAKGTVDPNGRPYTQAYPDASSGKPWSWLIAYLFARYRWGAGYNQYGPGRPGTNQYGNPYQAWAYMVEFTNEPNFFCWPQTQNGTATYACAVTTMFKTAEECSYFWASTGPPYVLGPGTLDALGDGVNTMSWDTFTANVVSGLQGWQPRKYVGWSLHNYGDVKYQHDGYRARRVIQLLYENGWKGGTDGNIFITESGLDMNAPPDYALNSLGEATSADEVAQDTGNHDTYTSMYYTPEAYCWLQHNVNNYAGDDFMSGLNRVWSTSTRTPGASRPYGNTWPNLGVA